MIDRMRIHRGSRRTIGFVLGFGAWTLMTCLLPLVFVLRPPRLQPEKPVGWLVVFLPFVLIPAVGSLVLWMSRSYITTTGKRVLIGVLLGVILPFLVGLVLMQFSLGFGSGQMITRVSLLTAAPSGFGGALAGWICSRSK